MQARERFPAAARLLEKAESMAQRFQGEDAEELTLLREELLAAIESNDSAVVAELTADLDDLLFYVQ